MAQKILFVEDDLTTGAIITKALQNKGFEVSYQNTLNGVSQVATTFMPDLLILDIEVGKANSLDEIPFIQLKCPSAPIIIVSSHTDGETVDRSYESGVCQFIKKPYEINELLHHIHQLLPDPKPIHANEIAFGGYRLNVSTQILSFGGEWTKSLNPKEFQLLRILLINKNKTVSRATLLQQVWNNEEADSSLNNYITYLRNYLSHDPTIQIQTIRKEGYTLTD